MARKTLQYRVTDTTSRDAGTRYLITEMSATDAEKWALRAFIGMAKNGITIPQYTQEGGMALMALYGLNMVAQLPVEEAEYLMGRMMDCVKVMPNDNNDDVVRELVEEDIQDVATRVKLRAEVFKLHVDFIQAGKLLKSGSAAPAPTPTS